MGGDLISVLMPIRDWRSTSASAILSILNQHHHNLELLLIGQSCLHSLENHLRQAGINDARIRLIARNKPGIVSALNTGLAQAQGKYIARMDDDDIAYPERFDVQLRYLRNHPTVDLCAACVRFMDANGRGTGIHSGNHRYMAWLNQLTEPAPIAHAVYAENPMPHPTLLAHRCVWENLCGYREVEGPEDHDLILRAMLNGTRMGKPQQILLDWREHENRLTHTDKRYHRRAFVAQSANALVQQHALVLNGQKRAVWIAGTGRHARDWHDELQADGIVVQGFVDMHRPGPQRRKRHLPVITYDELALTRANRLVISAVTQSTARSAVRAFFAKQGWVEGNDYIMGG